MIYFKDSETNRLYEVPEEEAEVFQEEYENPADLVVCEVYYSDGAGYNGKISRMAYGQDKNIKIVVTDEEKTNNEMEYLGLLSAMAICEEDSIILTDSKLVVNQIYRKWKCNFKHLEKLRDAATKLQEKKRVCLKWIPRGENLAGIKLDQTKK